MFKNIVFTIIILVVFLLFLEGGARLFYPVTRSSDRVNLSPFDNSLPLDRLLAAVSFPVTFLPRLRMV